METPSEMSSPDIFYTRWCHGGDQVRVLEVGGGRHYELLNVSSLDPGPPKVFKSARSLLMEIHGGRDMHITFDKYFKLGEPEKHPTVTVLDLFGGVKEISHTQISVDVFPAKKPLGIDLAHRGHEVAKLFYAGFGSSVIGSGYDPEDVLQQVYLGLMARNNGSCPFDPDKGSFGHYVHMVCQGVINNIHRRENKRRGREVVGLPTYVGGSWESADLSDNETICSEDTSSADNMDLTRAVLDLEEFIERGDLEDKVRMPAKEMVILLLEGHTQKEIMSRLGLSKAGLRKTLSLLRSEVKEWMYWA